MGTVPFTRSILVLPPGFPAGSRAPHAVIPPGVLLALLSVHPDWLGWLSPFWHMSCATATIRREAAQKMKRKTRALPQSPRCDRERRRNKKSQRSADGRHCRRAVNMGVVIRVPTKVAGPAARACCSRIPLLLGGLVGQRSSSLCEAGHSSVHYCVVLHTNTTLRTDDLLVFPFPILSMDHECTHPAARLWMFRHPSQIGMGALLSLPDLQRHDTTFWYPTSTIGHCERLILRLPQDCLTWTTEPPNLPRLEPPTYKYRPRPTLA